MTDLYIQSFACCFPDPENELETVADLIPEIPKRAARRMSTLGKQVHHVLRGLALDLETSLIYGTTYTESKALESYLGSLPFASPTAFQTSIHPGGIEQALIMRKQEVAALFPLAGNKLIFLQMLQTAFSCKSGKAVLVGGEEKASWLTDFDLAYPVSFAFAMQLDTQSSNAIGEINWNSRFQLDVAQVPGLEEAVRNMQQSRKMILGTPDHGQFTISWK